MSIHHLPLGSLVRPGLPHRCSIRQWSCYCQPMPVGPCCRDQTKRDCWHDKQIHSRDAVGMIADKGVPALGWRASSPGHILGHAGLTDFDSELEQLAVDVGRTPELILATHAPNQIPHLTGNNRSSYSAPSHFPGPKQAKSLPMPRDHRLRPDDRESRAPVVEDPGKKNPQQPVRRG